MTPSSGELKHIVLGISGGIAAYKAPDLVRLLKKKGYRVTPVLTKAALEFVSPLSLEVVAQERVLLDEERFSSESLHLSLARQADYLLVAPTTANCISKFSNGIADDLLSTLVMSFKKPRLLVPAMHTEMWENPATKRNVSQLRVDGFCILGPVIGDLACGDFGSGRMVDLDVIVDRVGLLDLDLLRLNGKTILVSSGGTVEPLDSMRAITNFSTGMLGRAIATVAAFFGAKVTLVSTTSVSNFLLESVMVASTVDEMKLALERSIGSNDTLIMAAAVSDFRPRDVSVSKIRRQDFLNLELEGTPDILSGLQSQKTGKTYIGFCLADDNLDEIARDKMAKKGLDYIIANKSATVGKDVRSLTIYKAGEDSPLLCVESQSVLHTAYAILKTCLHDEF